MPDTMTLLDASGQEITVKTNDYLAARIDLLTTAVDANTAVLVQMRDNPDPVTVAGTISVTDQTGEYEDVAASATAQPLGAAGNAGDYCLALLIIPATTSPGAVALLDGGTSKTVFTGGPSSVADLKPFLVVVQSKALNSGGWKVTTGLNVSVRAYGNFT